MGSKKVPAKRPPAKKKTKKAKKRKLDIHVEKNKEAILRGSVLVIDPSSGSRSSSPGYAEIVNGEIVDSGTIEIPYSKKVHERLRNIKTSLDKEFTSRKYDLLVLEALNIHQFKRMRAGSLLIESVGVFLACIPSDEVLYVSPVSWHAYVRRTYGDNYEKSDEKDARMMAELVISIAKGDDDV